MPAKRQQAKIGSTQRTLRRSTTTPHRDASRRNYNHQTIKSYIDRQTGEVFQATSQNRRVICTRGPEGGQRCRLRIDRAMQFRRVSYGRALQFIHSEQYLGDDDVNLIRYYFKKYVFRHR